MSEYLEIQAQIADLQRRATNIRAAERAAAIENIRSIMTTFEISAAELSVDQSALKRPRSTKAVIHVQKVPPKYRDSSGNEWSGRGLQPRWLKTAIINGATVESLLIN